MKYNCSFLCQVQSYHVSRFQCNIFILTIELSFDVRDFQRDFESTVVNLLTT